MELNKKQIKFLDRYTLGVWTLNEKTGLVDIDGDFYCSFKNLSDFKGVRFGEVKGRFNCSRNKLTSLVGAPQVVGGHFDCSSNNLTSLEGAPQEVGGNFSCSHNNLTSLEGAPQVVDGTFYCHNNPISSETLELVRETMQKNKIDYWTALCILKSEISKGDFKKLGGELNKRLSQDAQKGYSTLDQFGLFD